MMEDSDNPADGTPEAEAPHPPTKRDSDQVQTLTDERIAELNELLTAKEKEIMEL